MLCGEKIPTTSVHKVILRTKYIFSLYILIYLSTSLIQSCLADEPNSFYRSRPKIHQILLNDTIIPYEYQGLPFVGKCCPVGEIIIKDKSGASKCTPSEASAAFSPYFSDFNRSGVLAPGDERSRFLAVIGDPCQYNKYMLEPHVTSDDEHYLLVNGSIFIPHPISVMLSPGRHYCMEVIADLGLTTLVCFQNDDLNDYTDHKTIVYACILLLSVFALIMTIICYCITPELMNAYGKSLCFYCGCLVVAFLTSAITQLANHHITDEICIATAYIIQFSFVTCFFWLNVICIETYLQVYKYVHTNSLELPRPPRIFFYYSLWAWLPSGLLIIISLIMDLSPAVPINYLRPSMASQRCWFESDLKPLPYFYIPVCILIIVNVILLVRTGSLIVRHQRNSEIRRLSESNQDTNRLERIRLRAIKGFFITCLILFSLMGINWTIEVICWWAGSDPVAWLSYDLFMAAQGVLVFGLSVLRRPVGTKIWYAILKLRGAVPVERDVEMMDRLAVPTNDRLAVPNDNLLAVPTNNRLAVPNNNLLAVPTIDRFRSNQSML